MISGNESGCKGMDIEEYGNVSYEGHCKKLQNFQHERLKMAK